MLPTTTDRPDVATGDPTADAPARPRSGRNRPHPIAIVAWVVFFAALLIAPRLAPDEAAVRDAFAALGAFAPIAFVAAEIVQIVLVPVLPGQVFEVAAGWLFGFWPGVLLGTAGAVAGSLLAFSVARRFGRPWVEARIDPATRQRFERHVGRPGRAEWIVLVLMLLPAFPRDALCYLAGLTAISPTRFALIAAVGRPVGLVPWVALGAEGVAVGLRLQILFLAGVGLVWLTHELRSKFTRDRGSPSAILTG